MGTTGVSQGATWSTTGVRVNAPEAWSANEARAMAGDGSGGGYEKKGALVDALVLPQTSVMEQGDGHRVLGQRRIQQTKSKTWRPQSKNEDVETET